ncbi:MAG: hypothetical protein JWM09_746 [Francisellaceae bacterium]|nr:hypothetical protein [Francisellaceae bacterium]
MDEIRTLESSKQFSESLLWQLQKEYFHAQGIQAWVNQVPYYITSNVVIANAYANIIVRFMQDYSSKKDYDKNQPFYILELGTGPGKFSFQVIKKIIELYASLHLDMKNIKFIYIMSDFTDSNLKFWQSHSALQPFLDQGLLDFAVFDLEKTTEIHLINKKTILNKGSIQNPLILIGNYIFDTISHDAYSVKNNIIYDALITCKTPYDNVKEDRVQSMDQLEITFEYSPVKAPRYQDPEFNTILNSYEDLPDGSHFLIPVGGLKAIRNLSQIANDKLMLITSDKGYTTEKQLHHLGEPKVVFHGSFSMMVNFDALGKYFINSGGDYFHQSPRADIKTCVMLSFDKFQKYPEMALTIKTHAEQFGPGDFFIFHSYIRDKKTDFELKFLLAHMHFCQWDPHIFRLILDKLNKEIMHAEFDVQQGFIMGMHKVWDNFYYMPNNQDTPFEIGIFYHTIQNFNEALKYYFKSRKYFGEQFHVLYNIALCECALEDKSSALINFTNAYKLNPESEETKDWIEKLKDELKFNE